MLRNWRDELKRIVEFLNENDDDSRDLWFVLTALRGPDFDDPLDVMKLSTTAVIRHTVGIRNQAGILIEPDAARCVEARGLKPSRAEHFFWHADRAFRALGLKWDSLNASPEDEV